MIIEEPAVPEAAPKTEASKTEGEEAGIDPFAEIGLAGLDANISDIEDEDFISDVRAGKVNIETYEYVAHIKDNGKEFDKKCVGYNFYVED